MKKIITTMAIAAVAVLLSGFMLVGGNTDAGSDYNKENPVPGSGDFAGHWYLSDETGIEGLERVFPDIYAFGNEMEIRPDGRISWHIGAAGAAGTYEIYDNQLAACVADLMEDDEYGVALTMKNDEISMKYKGVPLKWTR